MLAEGTRTNSDGADEVMAVYGIRLALEAAIELVWKAGAHHQSLPQLISCQRSYTGIGQIIDLNYMLEFQHRILPSAGCLKKARYISRSVAGSMTPRRQ